MESKLLPVFGFEDSLIDYKGEFSFLIAFSGCNIKCKHCFVYESMQSFTEYSLVDLVEKISKSARLYSAIVFTGGEPCLYQIELEELCKVAKINNLKTKILTNGTNISFLEELVEKNLVDSIGFSIKSQLDLEECFMDYESVQQNILQFTMYNKDKIDIDWYIVKTKELEKDEDFKEFISKVSFSNIHWKDEMKVINESNIQKCVS